MMKITGMNFNEINFKSSDKVWPISDVNKSVKINDCKVIKKFKNNLEGLN